MFKSTLIEKINSNSTIIGLIGLGYVGLPLMIRFSEEDFRVIGFDIDEEKVQKLNDGESYMRHIPDSSILAAASNGFNATSDWKRISECDAILICVPTPLGPHKEPDLQYIRGTMNSIKSYIKKGQLLVLESTSYPGTTEETLVPVAEERGFTIGEDIFVGFSPEREDPGNQKYSTKTIPKVVSGVTANCLQLTKILYDQIVDQTVPVSSPKVAEMTKILENIHRAVNIGLVNELKMVADKMDIDIYEVINAAATKPFGFTPYYPGPGLGGHCIPIDPFYLTWKAKEVGMNTRFIELAGEINTAMPHYVFQKVGEALNSVGNAIKGSKILVLGLAYKKNVDDTRESPSLEIMEFLLKKGADVQYSDPYLPFAPKTRKFDFDLKSVELTKGNIAAFDLILLATDHDAFDYDFINKEARIIVDTRGIFKKSDKVFRA
jgi:UDP-N-acetyl-D-glucosamine dehydrogenase